MGKAGRIFCIATPMALTIASFICLILIQLSGWSSPSLSDYYFVQANFTNLNIAGASKTANSTTLTAALQHAKDSGALAQVYQIHLWNYCTETTNGTAVKCSDKTSGFVFDPVDVWQLNYTATTTGATATSTASNAAQSAINNLKANATALEHQVLGDAGSKALDAYRSVAHWMFIAYTISFWTTLATVLFGFLAIFSRWGSFLTWIASLVSANGYLLLSYRITTANIRESQVSSLFTFGAVLTSTVLFAALAASLEGILHPYGIDLSLGTHALAVTWIAVVCSWVATSFWLFSVCCCSGKSNPHHKSNKGGLWNAGGDEAAHHAERGRDGLRAEKTASGGYQRVASPYVGAASSEHVPLTNYPQPSSGFGQPSPGFAHHDGGYAPQYQPQQTGWEPYRHQR